MRYLLRSAVHHLPRRCTSAVRQKTGPLQLPLPQRCCYSRARRGLPWAPLSSRPATRPTRPRHRSCAAEKASSGCTHCRDATMPASSASLRLAAGSKSRRAGGIPHDSDAHARVVRLHQPPQPTALVRDARSRSGRRPAPRTGRTAARARRETHPLPRLGVEDQSSRTPPEPCADRRPRPPPRTPRHRLVSQPSDAQGVDASCSPQ